MTVKEFINILKDLPQDLSIQFGNDYYSNDENTSKYDLDAYNIENAGTKTKNHLTIWIEE